MLFCASRIHDGIPICAALCTLLAHLPALSLFTPQSHGDRVQRAKPWTQPTSANHARLLRCPILPYAGYVNTDPICAHDQGERTMDQINKGKASMGPSNETKEVTSSSYFLDKRRDSLLTHFASHNPPCFLSPLPYICVPFKK